MLTVAPNGSTKLEMFSDTPSSSWVSFIVTGRVALLELTELVVVVVVLVLLVLLLRTLLVVTLETELLLYPLGAWQQLQEKMYLGLFTTLVVAVVLPTLLKVGLA
jgi:hypothetical protein